MSPAAFGEYLLPEFDLNSLDLEGSESESTHLHAAFELTKEVACYLALGASMRDRRVGDQLSRDQAIVAGHLGRLVRLFRVMISQVASGIGGDQQLALSRQVIDSVATISYLLEGGREHGERFEAYVLDSLIAEREFAADVRTQITERGGLRLPIEDRIENSINETLVSAGIDTLAAVPSRKKNKWPSVESRVSILGPVVYSAYRVGSGAIHGSFTEIEKHHWSVTDAGIAIDLDPLPWRPQSLLSPSLIALDATAMYLRAYLPDTLQELQERIGCMVERLREADTFHEDFLQRRQAARNPE